MKLHILTNALSFGDAVSTHCILLKTRAEELGYQARLYAEFSDDGVREHVTPLQKLAVSAGPEDLLLHQLFNDTTLMPYVERFPGRRIMMYHNITPPEFFPKGSPVYNSCADGLRLVKNLTGTYDYVCGMSEFSRRDLERMGYVSTGVFPLFLDVERLLQVTPDRTQAYRDGARTTFLFVGRVAPNKCTADLLRFLAAYRKDGAGARLILAGDCQQHPGYVAEVRALGARLQLREGEDFRLTGKISEAELVAWYRSSDAFVSFSEHEGFGAPLIESMAFGLPTFAYGAGAVAETMGRAGVVFECKDDFDQIAASVRTVLHDEGSRAVLLRRQEGRVRDCSAPAQRQALRELCEGAALPAPRPLQSPRVSVVINTYNRSASLEMCLRTLRRQSHRNFEVIVVNGPSTDDTVSMLEQFRGQIRVLETKSRVLSVSRNVGIRAASGELVAFIDDDAVAGPDWLVELAAAFEDPAAGAAGGLVYRMNGRDIEFRNGLLDAEGFVRWDQPAPGRHWDWNSGSLNTVSGNNCMFRRAALEAIGGFDERIEYYHDEADVVMRLQLKGYRVIHRTGAVVYHEGAQGHNRRGKYTLNWRAICKNTLYVALKNYPGPLPKKALKRRIAFRVARARMGDILHWWMGRAIGLGEFIRMEYACAAGILEGSRRGLNPDPLYPSIPAVAEDAAFLEYGASGQDSFSVCLLSQALPSQSPGGIATYTESLAHGLARLGCSAHVISRGENWSSELKGGVWFHTVTPLPLQKGFDLADHPIARRNLEYSMGVRRKALDIESRWGLDALESPNWDAEGLFMALEHRTATVMRAHSPLFKVAETQSWDWTADLELCSSLERLLIAHVDAVTGSTKALLRLVDEHLNVGVKQTQIPLGLDCEGEAAAPRGGCKRVLFAGRLERRKGIHVLLQAVPEVLETRGDVEFDIVGRDMGGEERWADCAKGWSAEWRRRVRFHGEVSNEELRRLYASCDVFVAPSLYESFGLVYLEAMSYGKPVVGCDAGGIPEVVADGETGLLVPPGDAAALAGATLRILNDDAMAERMGTAGRQRFEERFTVETMAANTLSLYRKLAGRRAAGDGAVWRAAALDLRRDGDSRLAWSPLAEHLCLVIEPGAERTPVFGPYISLEAGWYRAEFKLWVEDKLQEQVILGRVDVFSMTAGTMGSRELRASDFAQAPGMVFDVYFEAANPITHDYEFRLHTTGKCAIYVREIVVSRWGAGRQAGA